MNFTLIFFGSHCAWLFYDKKHMPLSLSLEPKPNFMPLYNQTAQTTSDHSVWDFLPQWIGLGSMWNAAHNGHGFHCAGVAMVIFISNPDVHGALSPKYICA